MRTIARSTALTCPTRLADAPSLWVLDDFLDEPTIQDLLALFGDEAFLAANADHYGWDGSGFVAEAPADRHPVLSAVMARIEATVGIGSCQTPTFRFRYYQPGEGHRAHVDAYTFEDTRLAVSTLITLVAPEAGGETRFLTALPAPVAVEQRAGRLVAWTSTRAGGEDDPASLHDGAPVLRGAKGVLLGFVYRPLSDLAEPIDILVARRSEAPARS